MRVSDLWLVESKVLWPCNGSLRGRGQILARLAPGLNLSIDPLQHLHTQTLPDNALQECAAAADQHLFTLQQRSHAQYR